jgi:4-hydroxy-3-methylbut-2-enyl diphosphate reductase
MQVIIDDKSGFCFGVKNAIAMAEKELLEGKKLYCLGDIVHNENEVERLAVLGLKVITQQQYFKLSNCRVLLRAHGEPPEIYAYAKNNKIELLDGTCPVVNKLQQKVKDGFKQLKGEGTLIIFGKPEHPEVIGLNGQINYKAVVILSKDDLSKIDFNKPVILFSQTTMSREKFNELKQEIEHRIQAPELLTSYDTICGQVAKRAPWLKIFSKSVDAIVFAGGKKSSNGKVLFAHCKEANSNSFFVSSVEDVKKLSLEKYNKIGVCGATSTPSWLLEEVANTIKNINK